MIEWHENPKGRVPYSMQLALAEAALARQSGSATLLAQAGVLHERLRRPRKALDAFEASLAIDRDGFMPWAELAKVRARLGDPEGAREACRIGLEQRPTAKLARTHGDLLTAQGRSAAAIDAYRSALDLPGFDLAALHRLFVRGAQGQPGAWLQGWEELPSRYRGTAIARAWRAAALSSAGRRDAALAIINPAEQPFRIAFEPPSGFGGIEAFNRRLAAEIVADPPENPHSEQFHLNVTPGATSRPAWAALLAFVRDQLERAALRPEQFGLADDGRPSAATLDSISTVLSGDATNLQHLHQAGYLTAIYHVRVPAGIQNDAGIAGALELGGCDQILPGFVPCWERIHVKPRAGWLTVIPSHMFHDVIPTGTREPRISTAADLTPIAT